MFDFTKYKTSQRFHRIPETGFRGIAEKTSVIGLERERGVLEERLERESLFFYSKPRKIPATR